MGNPLENKRCLPAGWLSERNAPEQAEEPRRTAMRLRKRSELAVWILSLLLGFAGTCLYAEHAGIGTGTDTGIAGAAVTGAEAYAPLRREQAAWWGGLYPDYCLPGAMEAVDAEQDGTGDSQVKIRFKYLIFLNDKLEE